MGRGLQWTAEQKAQLMHYLEAGKTLPDAATMCGRSYAATQKMLKKMRRGADMPQYKGRAKAITDAEAADLATYVQENPDKSIEEYRQIMSCRWGGKLVPWSTLRDHVNKTSRALKPVTLTRLSPTNVVKRKEWSRVILTRFRMKRRLLAKGRPPLQTDKIVFSDEKWFKLEEFGHVQNKRIRVPLGMTRKDACAEMDCMRREKKTRCAGIMVGILLSPLKGLSRPFILAAGVKIDSKEYCSMLDTIYTPWLYEVGLMPGTICWQQDNAPAHISRYTLKHIKALWPGSELLPWPATSPDLNPVDYAVWPAFLEQMHGPFENLAALSAAIQVAYTQIDQAFMKKAAGEHFQQRVRECLARDGKHFKF